MQNSEPLAWLVLDKAACTHSRYLNTVFLVVWAKSEQQCSLRKWVKKWIFTKDPMRAEIVLILYRMVSNKMPGT